MTVDEAVPAIRRDSTLVVEGGIKVEQWGLCVSCDRWFYCGTSEQTDGCRCPACDQAPVAIRETWEA